MKNLILLGSTGSIGTNTLRVVRSLASRFRVVGLAAGRNISLLAEQCREFTPDFVYAQDTAALKTASLPAGTRILDSMQQLCDAVAAPSVDIVLCAISGTGGLLPVLSAIRAGKDIALASKEVLVMAGDLVTRAAAQSGSQLLPVDSEHCAIFQCLDGSRRNPPRRVILTCSGGPFHGRPELDLNSVTLEQTLKHPTWSMGRKVTIDSATLMNKGLEMIEAKWLFNVDEPQIEVVIHPQSIIHSMVEFADGSVLAQMGYPDMCLPIQVCLMYPERVPGVAHPMDFSQCLTMSFLPPDLRRFPALALARKALQLGGAAGAVFNAANEVAVEAFVEKRLSFGHIAEIVSQTLDNIGGRPYISIDELLDIDAQARAIARTFIDRT